ncbi:MULTISPECIES: hypothetical protein [Providencia]|uniref:hypothetical protein n=1 Tax=Providencia TaxID=586 RepID=UPI002021E8B3|nr:hypothetical protein [Providencia rettgeri]URE76906.1 hypothetical protein MWH14_10560 [Providencia stuartii]
MTSLIYANIALFNDANIGLVNITWLNYPSNIICSEKKISAREIDMNEVQFIALDAIL